MDLDHQPAGVQPEAQVYEGRGDAGFGFAIASLVLGIVGWTAVPIIPSILAVFFGYKARGEMKRTGNRQGYGMATAGLVLGWVAIILAVLVVLVAALFLIPAGIATFGAGALPLGG